MDQKTDLTIRLNGQISLEDFAQAMTHFSGLILELTKENAPGSDIEWIISYLAAGSAQATATPETYRPHLLPPVIAAYETAARAGSERMLIPYKPSVRKHAEALMQMIDDRIESVELWAGEQRYQLASLEVPEKPEDLISEGVISGVVQTVSNRSGYKFTLYDSLFDRAVTCYATADQESQMRGIWGKWVEVRGVIVRDHETGQPRKMRELRSIRILEEVHADLNALPGILGTLSAQEVDSMVKESRDG